MRAGDCRQGKRGGPAAAGAGAGERKLLFAAGFFERPGRKSETGRNAERSDAKEGRACGAKGQAERVRSGPGRETGRPPAVARQSQENRGPAAVYCGPRMSGKPVLGLPMTTTFELALVASFSVASIPFHSRS